MKTLIASVLFLFALTLARSADAYPWMVRHGYRTCNNCHVDPSGAGLLTPMGRDQGDAVMRFGPKSDDHKIGGFLFGLVPEPEGFRFGGSFRNALLVMKPEGRKASVRSILMQADLRAGLDFSRVKAAVSLGVIPFGGQLAAIIPDKGFVLASREHWLGVTLGEEFLVRAGRMHLPYGLRNNEHTMWIRSATRTDINVAQQHGVALSYSAKSVRGELMAIAGNYQLPPDVYRERGYSGYFEWFFVRKASLGVSSLITRADGDLYASVRSPYVRQAHGMFSRVVVAKSTVVLAQVDVLVAKRSDARMGYDGLVQVDIEPITGVHVLPAMEILKAPGLGGPSLGGWLSAIWFFAPHIDFRMDGIYRSIDTPAGRVGGLTALAQIHAYL
jgi:hypothetical protein